MRVEQLRETLLRLASEDAEVRERLAADGSLFDGYNSLMAIVHRRNGDHLADIVDAFGWPGFSLVGEDGADAAWLICKHAIAQPELQRRMLPLRVSPASRSMVRFDLAMAGISSSPVFLVLHSVQST